MKKVLLLITLALTTCIFFTACGTDGAPNQATEVIHLPGSQTPAAEPNIPDGGDPYEPDISEPIPDGFVRSELTNEFIDPEIADVRPIAVMIPAEKIALPQYNISKAGVLYEILVEGNISRMLAVIENWEELDKIGNIRSVRDYYVPLAYEWDALLVHVGNPYYADEILSSSETDNINGNPSKNGQGGRGAPDGTFFRTKDRIAPHNSYTSGAGINDAIKALKYSKTHTNHFREGHYTFAPENNPNTLSGITGAKSAVRVDFAKCYPIDKPYFEYNEDDGLYYRFQFGAAHIDGATKEQLAFKNIIIQNAYSETRDKNGYQYYRVHDNTRDGYFITNGKAIHVTWKKNQNFDATKYYDDNGLEVVFNTGKTMVCVVSDGREFTIE